MANTDMKDPEPSLDLPPAIRTTKRDDSVQHPLVTACMRPKKTNVVQCDMCKIFFKQKKFLREHQISEHGFKPEWQCKICDMVLCSKYNLNCHMDRHKDTKKHKCPVCPASFNTRASQRRHFLYKHTDERPHQCSICNFAAVEHQQLLIHLRNHTGESPYKCDTCGMTFKTSISYKRHTVTHTGWRQYLCVWCLKKFGAPATVKEHICLSHSVSKECLGKVRNVKEHGKPKMLAKFLENMKLDDLEIKMVNSLKYYEILESVVDETEVFNIDYNILKETVGKKIVDKSPFFILKNKEAIHIVHPHMKNLEYGDPNLSDSATVTEGTGTRSRYSTRKKTKSKVTDNTDQFSETETIIESATQLEKQNNYNTDSNDTEASDIVKSVKIEQMTDDSSLQVEKRGLKRKRGRNEKEQENQEFEVYEKESVSHEYLHINNNQELEVNKEVTEVEVGNRAPEGLELSNTVASNKEHGESIMKNSELSTVTDTRSSNAVVAESKQASISNFEKNDEITGKTSSFTAVEDNSVAEFDEDEDNVDSTESSVFINQVKKSFTLKTPQLNRPVSLGTECEIQSTRIDEKDASNHDARKPISDLSVEVVADDDMTADEDEIPDATSFVSVRTNSNEKGSVSDIGISQVDSSESGASLESYEINMFQGGLLKSLPPFISLERCSQEHRDRLLMAMKKGWFGPTPSVVRVSEDGSMINVSNNYKAFLPPSVQ